MQSAAALPFFKKKVSELPDYINEEILIDRLFQASDGVYKLHITILIPKGLETLTLTVMYDQLKQKKIQDLAWIKGSNTSAKFFNFFRGDQNKKPKFEKIYPFKKEEFIKEGYEFEKESPDLKYDRVAEQKFIVYKRYQFYQKDIFGDGRKKSDHLLEFHFEDGTSRAIRIRKEIYHDERYFYEEKFLPTMFGDGVKPDPRVSPKPVLPKDARDDAIEKYNQYMKEKNDVTRSRQQEQYDSAVEHMENTYGTEQVPEFDGMYR